MNETTTHNPYSPPAELAERGPSRDPVSAIPSERMLESLAGMRPWLMFLAILGFISAGFMALGALAMVFVALLGGASSREEIPIAVALGGAAFYLIGGGVYAFLSVLLIRTYGAIGGLLGAPSAYGLEEVLAKQHAFWKVLGITVIVSMGIGLLAVIGLVAVGVATAL